MAHKSWQFTFNNYNENDIEMIKQWTIADVNRLTISKEIAPTTGTPHLQGFVTFKKTKKLSGLKKLSTKIHWEPKKVDDGIYELKPGSEFVINFISNNQGKRSDLEEIAEKIKSKPLQYFFENHTKTMIMYNRGVTEVWKRLNPTTIIPKYSLSDFPWNPIIDWTTSHIIWGPSGVGKTEFAKAHFANPFLVSHKDDLRNFNPDIHDGIIFDDMNFKHWPRESQIHITDIDNPRSIDIKYGTACIPANTKKIFTTNINDGFILDITDPAISRRVTVTEVGER